MRGVVVGVLVVLAASSGLLLGLLIAGYELPIGDQIAVIYMDGYLITEDVPSGWGVASSEAIAKAIRQAVDDGSVRAIVLRVNSPGGSIAASEEIRAEVMRARQAGKPVVASMGSVAASGAYHVASACDYIMCSNATLTGGVGVLWVFEDRSGYYDDEGIQFFIAKSGELKDMGTDTRPLTEEERAYAQEVVSSLFEKFISDVQSERNLTQEATNYISDGRVLTGIEALELGLVDGTGGLFDAIDKAAELAGISEYGIRYMEKPSITRLLLGAQHNETQIRETLRHVGVGWVVSTI
ncbi:signal peptide peptidase SppA [Methermicoccus shengliensis]|uniref:Signal peptide peptidase SppA n=1 Tax=Methermicoccus shengliensis TaxID=660064 RepID=A0A832VY12_9EURY|nr:signal peptide peptidase SppA [Methermicoccus shengliensis]KUK04122.1 MAG: Periplasmic serine protease [Euryarchaeota archaeon 55_53]KUK29966.1 MAG: Periplasmic serine protease [Methanosarcinales archeaon 56_1174]MDI3487980.1 protease [Methanosarcinales archaeon]MDN5295576.1 protease [Methanosarcinales archaeon]HIH70367.1 signal peptide peptidase SppA [Methermicoccus shengliensis]